MNIKHWFSLSLLGLVTSGFAGGMIFAHYKIPLDLIIIVGSIMGIIGMSLTILSLSKIKGIWSFEIVEED